MSRTVTTTMLTPIATLSNTRTQTPEAPEEEPIRASASHSE
jgi:hypothetical protein